MNSEKNGGVINHRLDFDTERSLNYRVYDHWSDIPDNAYLYTSAITDCVAGKELVKVKLNNYNKAVTLKVRAPQLGATDELYLVGARACIRCLEREEGTEDGTA